MHLYTCKFGFRLPYQILLDGNFLHASIKMKSDLFRNLSKILLGSVKIMTTSCVYKELMELGLKETASTYKTFERKFCSHPNGKLSASDCIKSIIGSDNKHRFAVATLDKSLRVDLAEIPGVPLLYINKSVYILEPPSGATLGKSLEIETQKLNPSESELKLVEKILPVDETATVQKKLKKKEPNPLSIKKKKVALTIEKTVSKSKHRKRSKRPIQA